MRRTLVLMSLASLFLLRAPALAASPYGVDGFLSTRMSGSEMATGASALQDLQAGWTRQEFNYENIGGAHGANFGADSDALAQSQAKGIKVLGLLNFGSDTPPSVSDWTSFVTTVVSHFADKVDAWEVMNEPNDAARPSRQMSPSVYLTYLSPSFDAIRRLDPTATVVSAGTAAVDVSWINQLLTSGGCSKLDAIGIHPYRNDAPELIKFGEGDFINYIRTAVAGIRSNCPGKKLWLTEFGLRSDVVGTKTQADYLARSFLMARAIPEVQTILSYNLRDDSSGNWGLVDANFHHKAAYDELRQVLHETGNQAYDGDITITNRNLIDEVESTDGWSQKFSNNASANLSMVDGGIDNGKALQVDYNFTADSAAVILTNDEKLSGEPTAIGIHMDGDSSNVIWRLRFKDAQGETFQALLGNPVGGWSYQQFDLSYVNAMTSWNGDGKIQYPITFDSIVLDRNGGPATGSVKFDKIVAIYGPADLHAYKFGSTVAAWKGLNFQTVSVCGQNIELSQTPVYLENVADCRSNAIGGSVVVSPSDTPSSSASVNNSVSITSPKDGTATKSRSLSVRGKYSPQSAGVTVKIDGKTLKVSRNTKAGTWSAKSPTLAYATHTITASVGDAQSSVSVTVKKK